MEKQSHLITSSMNEDQENDTLTRPKIKLKPRKLNNTGKRSTREKIPAEKFTKIDDKKKKKDDNKDMDNDITEKIDEQNNLECQICGAKPKDKKNYNRHMRTKHPEAEKKSTCEFCGEEFNSILERDQHYGQSHPCHICLDNKIFDLVAGKPKRFDNHNEIHELKSLYKVFPRQFNNYLAY